MSLREGSNMNCEEARTQLSLYLLSELDFSREELLEQHLDGCPACREELAREKALNALLQTEDARLEVPAGLLSRCRADFAAQLAPGAPEAGNAFVRWWNRLGDIVIPPAALFKAAGVAALVAAGFFAGRSQQRFSEPPGWTAARVKSVEAAGDGQIRVVLDETRQREVSGAPEEEQIQRLLLAAVKDPTDPGLRVESVQMLRGRSESSEVRQALIHALENDENDGVRLKAIEGLNRFARELDTRRALTRVLLRDANPGIRTQAVDLLMQNMAPAGLEQETVGAMQEVLLREENGYIRLRCQKALAEMKASPGTF
ncbi:MAG: hypothetical protein FJW40_07220 [Acidobacteria bacterium]|nr:hypothetical protein [Acidobacteriota bacterium]